MYVCVYRHDFSHFKHYCRFCCVPQSADEELYVGAFLVTSYTVLSWHPKQDVNLLFLLQCVCICFMASLFVCTVWVYEWLCVCVFCHCRCVSGCVLRRTVFWAKVDIRLTDIGGDSSTVAYGNRLLTAKTWHQRKQVSQAWHSVLLRGLRDRLSAYSRIITPITSTIIPDKGEGSQTKNTGLTQMKL